MAAITALANIGYPHPNDGGLRTECIIQLSEGDRPAWVLDPAYIWGTTVPRPPRQVVWIPTLDTMAEDLMLMIGVHVLPDQELIQGMQDAGLDPTGRRLELGNVLHDARQQLYDHCRQIESPWKVALTVFDGSYLQKRLSALANYAFQLEVCTSVFSRSVDRWNGGKYHITGALEVA